MKAEMKKETGKKNLINEDETSKSLNNNTKKN